MCAELGAGFDGVTADDLGHRAHKLVNMPSCRCMMAHPPIPMERYCAANSGKYWVTGVGGHVGRQTQSLVASKPVLIGSFMGCHAQQTLARKEMTVVAFLRARIVHHEVLVTLRSRVTVIGDVIKQVRENPAIRPVGAVPLFETLFVRNVVVDFAIDLLVRVRCCPGEEVIWRVYWLPARWDPDSTLIKFWLMGFSMRGRNDVARNGAQGDAIRGGGVVDRRAEPRCRWPGGYREVAGQLRGGRHAGRRWWRERRKIVVEEEEGLVFAVVKLAQVDGSTEGAAEIAGGNGQGAIVQVREVAVRVDARCRERSSSRRRGTGWCRSSKSCRSQCRRCYRTRR